MLFQAVQPLTEIHCPVTPVSMAILTELSERIKAEGFEHFGFAQLKRPLSMGLYREWIQEGCHAGMDYLERHLPFKENPQSLMPKARSAIVVTAPYYPNEESTHRLKNLRTALYAHGEDYHLWLTAKLDKLISRLREVFPEEQFLCYADSKPITERELASRAGLGWIGKNGCLIDRKYGSLFFIGEIFTTMQLEDSSIQIPDHCGTCDRCIKGCPTQAIRPNRTLDARLCISYWTIEAKGVPPPEIRGNFSDWFFGCDVCQTVCPWNEKVFGKTEMQALTESRPNPSLTDDLRWCLNASNSEMEKELRNTPLLRARARGLRRNALIVIGNLRLKELEQDVRNLIQNHPALEEVAVWTLGQLKSP
jgi:epoxyqueuosine reductase